MLLPPLTDGHILRRYKRFLADIELADGQVVCAHVPNTGSMASCWQPGAPVQISHSDNPRRKLSWTLERVDMGGGWIGVNTARPNQVMAQAIASGRIASLTGYRRLRREVSVEMPGLASGRLDVGLSEGHAPDALVEVKNVTLLDGALLRFPDARSERARRHLDLLIAAVDSGLRGIMLFALNRPEGQALAPAWDIDPAYAERLCAAASAGVEIIALRMLHRPEGIDTAEQLPVDLTLPASAGE
ncbi:MAG: DNA/RNA nuclease SfsA [Thiohalocapsa sp. PB-PSB1]|nr:MAG: DNA/RNA nuclease SfsA [Thiohalocapsa sp. PB-PSB1]